MIGVFITYWRNKSLKNQTAYLQDSSKNKLIGRDEDLNTLTQAWHDDTKNLFILNALGGTGKSALIQGWLTEIEKHDWLGADNVFAWSFPDVSDSTNLATLATEFIDYALTWFGPEKLPSHPLERLTLLGKLIQRQRTLLILDNFPDFHYEVETNEQAHQVQPLGVLLNCLAAYNPGLCVVATRQPITACDMLSPHIYDYPLANLSGKQGGQLLEQLGVKAINGALEQLATNFCGHALTLTLLGSYMAHAHNGKPLGLDNVLMWRDVEREGLQTRRIMAVLEHWLWHTPDILLLYLISLLDRPVTQQEIYVLLHSQRQPWFKRWLKRDETLDALAPLSRLSVRDFSKVQRRLYNLHLLTASPLTGTLDTHAIIRQHFRERVKLRFPTIPERLQALLETCIQKITAVTPPTPAQLPTKCYLTLPDLPAAVQSTRQLGVKLEQSALKKHWYRAAIIAHHLCEHHLILGNIPAAVYCARRSVAYAELSQDQPSLLQNLKLLMRLLTLTGSSQEASVLLQRARNGAGIKTVRPRLPVYC